MVQVETLVVLLAIVTALVVAAQKLALPYPVLLVLGGLGISFIPGLTAPRLNPEFVFFFCLPPLIYPTALFTSWRDFRANLRPILLLAIGLVLFTMAAVACVAHALIPELRWAAAFALGAIVSPPDAVAAAAVIRRLSVPRRIEGILEGESLVNDATALVALQFAVAALVTGKFSLLAASGEFVLVAAGGIGIGLVVGYLIRHLRQHVDDTPVNITISLLTPFVAYLLAEQLHLSGVLAVVAAGVYLGWHGPVAISPRVRLQAYAVWEMVVFLLNGLLFILIGLQLPAILQQQESWWRLLGAGAAVSATVILVRIAWVYPATYLPRLLFRSERAQPKPAWQNVALVSWAGMRGVISLAAAFALPFVLADGHAFPSRGPILFITFCVILTTLVGQGLTLPWLIRRLKISDDGLTDEEERLARRRANEAALALIDQLAGECGVPEEIVSRLRAEYRERIDELEQCAQLLEGTRGEMATPHYRRLQLAALKTERQTIIQLRNDRAINDEALRRIQRDLDLAEERLDHD